MLRVFLLVALTLPLLAQQHGFTPTDVENRARLYRAQCAACHGPEGDLVAGANLRAGKFRRAASDDDLTRIITKGIPGTPMPPSNLQSFQVFALIAYLHSMREQQPMAAGDARRGRELLEGKGACLTCHRIKGKGARTAPDLSDIGAIRTTSYLQRSILDPSASILPLHRTIRAVTRNGAVITGRRLNEDTDTLQLLDSKERLVSLRKADLREYAMDKASAMPSYKDKLSSQEVSDLVNYLVSLKGSDTP